MRKKLSKKKKEMPLVTQNIIGILLSCFIGLVMTVIFTGLLSIALTKSSVITDTVGAYFIGCVMLGAVIAGFIASKRCTFKGILSGFVSSILYSLFVTVVMLFFSNGQINSKTVFLYAGIILCSVIGGILSANTKRRK